MARALLLRLQVFRQSLRKIVGQLFAWDNLAPEYFSHSKEAKNIFRFCSSLGPDLLSSVRMGHAHLRLGSLSATSAPGLGLSWRRMGLGSPPAMSMPGLTTPSYIYAGTGLSPFASAPGLSTPLPHLCRHWAHPCHICTGTERTISQESVQRGL